MISGPVAAGWPLTLGNVTIIIIIQRNIFMENRQHVGGINRGLAVLDGGLGTTMRNQFWLIELPTNPQVCR